MISSQPDIALWEAYKHGDREAFGLLFRKYYTPLFQFGNKFLQDPDLLEDCIQELFVELWQSKSQTSVQSVKAYLFKSLKYKIFRLLNKKAGAPTSLITDNMLFELSPETLLIGKQESEEKVAKVITALQQLSNRQKEIIYLKFYKELSYEEVSEVMNINYQVARNLLYQSIKALKKALSALSVLTLLFA